MTQQRLSIEERANPTKRMEYAVSQGATWVGGPARARDAAPLELNSLRGLKL
jgi:hypothetical protein